jgi:xanthine dehydrogenase accessory factor
LNDPRLVAQLQELLRKGKPVALCTIVEKTGSSPRNEGAKMIIDSDGNTYGTVGGGGMERRLIEEALKALDEGKPRTIIFALGVEPREEAIPIDSRCGGEVKIFMDIVKPDPRLIVIGSGHIGMPLAHLAHETGFETIVVDDAPTTTRERFPHAAEIHSNPFQEEIEGIETTPADYVAIVHGESWYELTALRGLLPRKPAYVGLLGSRNKAGMISERLISEGLSVEDVARISSPIGIDIGAETPEEIAVSIVAELIKVRRIGAP